MEARKILLIDNINLHMKRNVLVTGFACVKNTGVNFTSPIHCLFIWESWNFVINLFGMDGCLTDMWPGFWGVRGLPSEEGRAGIKDPRFFCRSILT